VITNLGRAAESRLYMIYDYVAGVPSFIDIEFKLLI
jgi:hypothetical protein